MPDQHPHRLLSVRRRLSAVQSTLENNSLANFTSMFDLSLSQSRRSSRSSRSSKSSLASTISTSSTSLGDVYDLKYAFGSQSQATLASANSRIIAEDLDDDNVAWGPIPKRKQRRN